MNIKFESISDYFCDEVYTTPNETAAPEPKTSCNNKLFENFRKDIVSTVAYLIGINDLKFEPDDLFHNSTYEELKRNEAANIIRYLCILRTQFFKNYSAIEAARMYEMKQLEELKDLLDTEAIVYLKQHGIDINVANVKSAPIYIAYINQYILENIDKIRHMIPDWIKFQYIKSFFLLPGGYAGHKGSYIKSNQKKVVNTILAASRKYACNKNSYPFQEFINWPCDFNGKEGFILYNDFKFLSAVYTANNDNFRAVHYIIDAKSETKEGVYEFLEGANNAAIFVDCENVDPYAFGATLLNLNNEMLGKIKKIVLYNDVHTSAAWHYINEIIDIPFEKNDIIRVLSDKSLVDTTLTAGVCKEHYSNEIDSIILASSDSDYWGLITTVPTARFLVLNEKSKTSDAINVKMDEHEIQHCYMSDFAQDRIQSFKTDVLFRLLKKRIDHFNSTGKFGPLNIRELLKNLFYEAGIGGADSQLEKEKEAFYNKYLKHGLLMKPVEEDGKLVMKIELYRH
ncbi:MAG: hypothetical protein IKU19_03270 [Clostridia bacterium]|nr:hypothetical protein [Clostridia bacterium]